MSQSACSCIRASWPQLDRVDTKSRLIAANTQHCICCTAFYVYATFWCMCGKDETIVVLWTEVCQTAKHSADNVINQVYCGMFIFTSYKGPDLLFSANQRSQIEFIESCCSFSKQRQRGASTLSHPVITTPRCLEPITKHQCTFNRLSGLSPKVSVFDVSRNHDLRQRPLIYNVEYLL